MSHTCLGSVQVRVSPVDKKAPLGWVPSGYWIPVPELLSLQLHCSSPDYGPVLLSSSLPTEELKTSSKFTRSHLYPCDRNNVFPRLGPDRRSPVTFAGADSTLEAMEAAGVPDQ
jgi:hypothetical protein